MDLFMTDYFKEPLPPGVKNLDNYEIDFPEHNLKDYVCYSNKDAKDPYKEFQEWLLKMPKGYELVGSKNGEYYGEKQLKLFIKKN